MTEIRKQLAALSKGKKVSSRARLSTERDAGWKKNARATALRVLTILREQGLNQKILAERLGVSPQQVSKILSGRENITYETVDKIEKALGVKLILVLDYKSNLNERIIRNITNEFHFTCSWDPFGNSVNLEAPIVYETAGFEDELSFESGDKVILNGN